MRKNNHNNRKNIMYYWNQKILLNPHTYNNKKNTKNKNNNINLVKKDDKKIKNQIYPLESISNMIINKEDQHKITQ